MNRERRRAVLETVVSAPEATPGERLRAVELLREFDADEPGRALALEAAESEADPRELDSLLAPVFGGERMLTDAD